MKPVIVSHCEKCGKREHINLRRGMKTAACPGCGHKKALYNADHTPEFTPRTEHASHPSYFIAFMLLLFLIAAIVLGFTFI